MRRRTVIRWTLLSCAGLLLLPCGFFGLMVAVQGGSDKGSPALAAEWRDRLVQYSDPDAARSADPEVLVVRCRNGEWAFGRSKDSHGVWRRGGGTLVVRDSAGRVRAFFGHVCGGQDLGGRGTEPPSLAAYYDGLAEREFVEHPSP